MGNVTVRQAKGKLAHHFGSNEHYRIRSGTPLCVANKTANTELSISLKATMAAAAQGYHWNKTTLLFHLKLFKWNMWSDSKIVSFFPKTLLSENAILLANSNCHCIKM